MGKRMRKTSWLIGITSLLLVFILGACGNNGEGQTNEDEVVNIGILLSAEHGSLTAAQEGFVEELAENNLVDGENAKITVLNAQNSTADLHDMAQQLVDENDLVLGVSTSSAQSLASVSDEIPILFTATTDPLDAGLVESMDEPGGNITGTSDMVPFEEQIELLVSIIPESEKIGIIYNSSESNSEIQANLAKQAIEESGREAVIMTVTSTNDVQQVATNLMEEVDGIYIPTDNTLASAAVTVGELAIEHQIPIVAGSIDHTAEGGLATFGINYHSLGKQTGKMAIEILQNDASPANMPVETAENLELFINEEMAEALGIEPESIQLED